VIAHYYHLWLGGDWQTIAEEHISLLRRVEFDGEVRIGLVGPPEEREKAKAWLNRRWNWKLAAEADTGFEDVTLAAMYEDLSWLPSDTAVLYAHNKGSFHPQAENTAWRRAMQEYLVVAWKTRIVELKWLDVMAWTWLPVGTYDVGPAIPEVIDIPMAAGNFWWASSRYLRSLDAPPTGLIESNRIKAEVWLGAGDPEVGSECTGWPRIFIPLKWIPDGSGMAGSGRWVTVD
jgi:hypothetical protein